MARGPASNNPNLRLTPVPSVLGGDVLRNTRVRSDAATAVGDGLAGDAFNGEWTTGPERSTAATTTDMNALAACVTAETEEHVVLDALENPSVTPAIIDRAARHPSTAVRRASALHPNAATRTLHQLRSESEHRAEVLEGYGAEPSTVPEPLRQEAAANRDLITVIDQLLALQDGYDQMLTSRKRLFDQTFTSFGAERDRDASEHSAWLDAMAEAEKINPSTLPPAACI